jgi:hypothetical protein
VHHHDEHAGVLTAQLDVLEEPGGVERAQRFADALRTHPVADVHRQLIENRALGDALQAFDADGGDSEVRAALLRGHRGGSGGANYQGECRQLHGAIRPATPVTVRRELFPNVTKRY